MLTISELNIYPIKSLGGVSVNEALLTDRGFQHDRRWMLVNSENVFLSQRELNSMALFKVAIIDNGLVVQHTNKPADKFFIPFECNENESVDVQVWDDVCKANYVNDTADEWFSEMLSYKCRLVYMPDNSNRLVDLKYAMNNEVTSFSDGYPLLIIGKSSLDDLNSKLAEPLPMNRFRPNIVFEGGTPFQEDEMKIFEAGGITFYGVKLCARCVVTTIDQQTAIKNKEPLKTLSKYRMWNNKIYFGQNLLYKSTGVLRIGDIITPL